MRNVLNKYESYNFTQRILRIIKNVEINNVDS